MQLPAALRELTERLCREWGFVPTEELPGGHCSVVLADATRVMKVPFQGEEQASGWRMAVAMSGTIGPDIERVDEESGVMLMERIMPGTPMSAADLSDADALEVVLGFGAQIATLPIDGLMPVEDFVDPSSPWYAAVAGWADRVALHGDLHHENILLGARGWVVIDPKGLVGDPAFEPSAYLRNPLALMQSEPDLGAVLDRRLAWIRERTGWPESVVLAWAALALGDGPHDAGWDRLAGEFARRLD